MFSCLPQKTKMVFFGLLRNLRKQIPSILGKHKRGFPEDGGKEKEEGIAVQSLKKEKRRMDLSTHQFVSILVFTEFLTEKRFAFFRNI